MSLTSPQVRCIRPTSVRSASYPKSWMSRETTLSPPAALVALEAALASVLRGKPEVVRLSLVCLLARGHLLIEDVPGVGKTTLAQALARSVDSQFHRLQFTSDMLPSDVLGVTIYNAHTEAFEFKPGPIFTNFLLADEINRTTPKTQSALLEAMNEAQVTIDGRSHPAAAALHGDRHAESRSSTTAPIRCPNRSSTAS